MTDGAQLVAAAVAVSATLAAGLVAVVQRVVAVSARRTDQRCAYGRDDAERLRAAARAVSATDDRMTPLVYGFSAARELAAQIEEHERRCEAILKESEALLAEILGVLRDIRDDTKRFRVRRGEVKDEK